MKIHVSAILALALMVCGSQAVQARDLGEDMDILGANYSAVLKTNDPATLKKALSDMHDAAQDARNGTPPKLRGQSSESPQMQDYRQAIGYLLSQIEQAQALAIKGDIKQAKAVAQTFKHIRDENHAKFR
jgi:soluble cytochrome b562